MTKFERRFLHALNEQDSDRAAMEQSLDQGTNPEDFDTAPTSDNVDHHTAAAATATANRHNEYINQITNWTEKLTAFNEYLNGTNKSIQTSLANAVPGTILDTLKKEQSRITRAATEISALIQQFNAALNTQNDFKLKGV